jgi:hypothetical protein
LGLNKLSSLKYKFEFNRVTFYLSFLCLWFYQWLLVFSGEMIWPYQNVMFIGSFLIHLFHGLGLQEASEFFRNA